MVNEAVKVCFSDDGYLLGEFHGFDLTGFDEVPKL
jgi:hypothetical protein